MSWQAEVVYGPMTGNKFISITCCGARAGGAHDEVLIKPDDIDALIQRLETLKDEAPLKDDRGQFVLIWPEALRQLQAVLDGEDEMSNDAEHELLIELAETAGLVPAENDEIEELDGEV